jgi:hypothetical protein
MNGCKYDICTASESNPETRGLRGCACLMEERMEPTKYSAEWIRDQVTEKKATRLNLRCCSLCNTELYYSFEPADVVTFSSSCECVNYYSPPRSSSFEEIARNLAMQSSDKIRDDIMSRLV